MRQTRPVRIDWDDGDYSLIAAGLAPAAEVLLDAAAVGPGQRVLDVGCGTGNVAMAAAARGASATGGDPAPGRRGRARARAAAAGADAAFLVGDAGGLPVPDGGFDASLSAFGAIFAPDPARAVGEMLRATRPGGVVAMTSWTASGAIFAAGHILRGAFPEPEDPPPRWEDAAWVEGLLAAAGAREVRSSTAELGFRADSPEAWLAEQVAFHPAWRAARGWLEAERWDDVRGRMLAALAEGNEDASAFLATSGYLVTVARR